MRPALNPGEESLRPLHPAVRTVWRIKLGILMLAALIAVAAYEVIRFIGGTTDAVPAGVPTLFTFLFGLALTIFQPTLRYRFWRFDLRSDELYLERGIINRVRTIVPLRRIQHIDVSQDVLEREFNLGKLVVHTAGARSSEVVLPGLFYQEAENFRDRLKEYIVEDAV